MTTPLPMDQAWYRQLLALPPAWASSWGSWGWPTSGSPAS